MLTAQNSASLPIPGSPGASSDDAAEAAARFRAKGKVEILTDTQGVDFGPYLSEILAKVRQSWFTLIPEDAKTKRGELAIEFAVIRDGRIADMRLKESSGYVPLDRAAWGAISASNPFPALPEAFHGPYLALRLHFLYNPDRPEIASFPTKHATVIQDVADANLPEYPKKALHQKIDGIVRLVAQIAPDGTVESVATVEGDPILGDSALKAIRHWRFQPAERNGKPVEERIRIRVEFQLAGKRVRTDVMAQDPTS